MIASKVTSKTAWQGLGISEILLGSSRYMALGSSRCCWADEPGLEGLFITTQLYCQKIPYKVTVRPISKRAANDLEGRSP